MAWTVIQNTPQIKTMVEAAGATTRSSDIDTTGYDKMIFFNSGTPNAYVEAKIIDNAGASKNGFYPVESDAGIHNPPPGNPTTGYCTLLPETACLTIASGAIGNLWVELRRTVTHDRGRG